MLCTQYRYIQCYVKRVKILCYVETRDIHIFVHNFLNIQPIFFLCMSKHVKGVESQNNF